MQWLTVPSLKNSFSKFPISWPERMLAIEFIGLSIIGVTRRGHKKPFRSRIQAKITVVVFDCPVITRGIECSDRLSYAGKARVD
jgi:hypothetical protein